jgi:hypothetical protein
MKKFILPLFLILMASAFTVNAQETQKKKTSDATSVKTEVSAAEADDVQPAMKETTDPEAKGKKKGCCSEDSKKKCCSKKDKAKATKDDESSSEDSDESSDK